MTMPADDPIVQQLIERGLLATGGNIRPIPFANNGVASNAAANANTASSSGNGVTRNADGTYNVTDNNGNEQTVDPRQAAEQLGEDPNSDLSWLAAMIAGATGAYVGSNLRRGKPVDPLAPLDDPKQITGMSGVEYDTRGTGLAARGDDIIDGEYSVVEPKGVAPRDEKALPDTQKRLVGPTAQELAKRRASARNVATGEQSRVSLPDEFADFTPEELARARMIAEQLVMRRQGGNVRAYNPNAKGVGPQHKPTSPGRRTETVDQMMGNVARILRDQKAIRSLQKVVR